MKLFSWNVNGIRAVINKGEFAKFIRKYDPDIICLQETKAKRGQAEIDLPEYEEYWNSADKPGYAGTAIFVKKQITVKPVDPQQSFLGSDKLHSLADQFGDATREGRLTTLELEDFYLVNTYSPHGKRENERLPLKQKWDTALLAYIKHLEETKPVIICGDFNIAHQNIDLANPKENQLNAGFTAEERTDFDAFMQANFIDTFRYLHPNQTGAYTWWTWRANARARNVGWRIDYFLISKPLKSRLKSADIYQEQLGSDHCPISIIIK